MDLQALRDEYLSGCSSVALSKKYGVSKKTILNQLQSLEDWDTIKRSAHPIRKQKKTFDGTCLRCNEKFENKKIESNYCSHKCYKLDWQRKYRSENREIVNQKKRDNRNKREKKLSLKKEWELKFKEKISKFHKRNIDKTVNKILKRSEGIKNSMVARSKKFNVECTISVDDIRELIYDAYGTKCKYCDKILTIQNLVLDHIHPISKGGVSNKDNLQVICKTSNSMKGSLDQESFRLLLDWLETIPENLKKDISIRLSRGIH